MVLICIKCGLRARGDRSCRNIQCEDFRPGERGQHWRRQRLQQALGDLASKVGVFAVGGLLHRVRLEQALVVLFTVNVIRCLPMQGWGPLCQTCSLLKRITAPKFEPAQSHCTATCAAVSALIPRIARLFETGQLSAGALLKVKGHAFDLIEICAPCMTAISVEMLSVMILRFSVKYEMRKEDASVALGVLRVPEPRAVAEWLRGLSAAY